ncbi:aspartate-semialdehyde dehydrogenase [Pseudomonas sp. R5(2019)]|uniref:aspartate-semialdehyde dehydrogenase n=1 Tax=Pseudomonas sp. R5(2019) TaxID=2697566 RepID=UPI001412720C|nr:aspartate-semialdehyde dehydrogenase [Pseudomonas sp. R5(2019)]NBA94624.1 aspartate-semialdehyde dehydrogenase [Pseudomonas sp. R5(2019)]
MLPPIIPLSVIPVTSQLDPVKQAPSIPPVVPAQPTSSDSAIDLKQRDPHEAALLLREEQHRQQRQRQGEQGAEAYLAIPGDELNADNTVPVAPLIDDEPRQGLIVDIEV